MWVSRRDPGEEEEEVEEEVVVGNQSAPASQQGELLPKGKLYYRIGEVAKITGVKPHVLRYWETEFRWMAPPKSRSKQRLYRHKDIEMILAIKRLLYDERYTIAGARQQLRDLGASRVVESARLAAADDQPAVEGATEPIAEGAEVVSLGDRRAGYRRIRNELIAIRELL
jgi:DNA-binding transcriptional MerR regulator